MQVDVSSAVVGIRRPALRSRCRSGRGPSHRRPGPEPVPRRGGAGAGAGFVVPEQPLRLAPKRCGNTRIPASRSPVRRGCAAAITSTGARPRSRESGPAPTGGNHEPHRACSPGPVDQPISRADPAGPATGPGRVLPEPGDRPVPADPLREHCRRHVRELFRQRSHCRSDPAPG